MSYLNSVLPDENLFRYPAYESIGFNTSCSSQIVSRTVWSETNHYSITSPNVRLLNAVPTL